MPTLNIFSSVLAWYCCIRHSMVAIVFFFEAAAEVQTDATKNAHCFICLLYISHREIHDSRAPKRCIRQSRQKLPNRACQPPRMLRSYAEAVAPCFIPPRVRCARDHRLSSALPRRRRRAVASEYRSVCHRATPPFYRYVPMIIEIRYPFTDAAACLQAQINRDYTPEEASCRQFFSHIIERLMFRRCCTRHATLSRTRTSRRHHDTSACLFVENRRRPTPPPLRAAARFAADTRAPSSQALTLYHEQPLSSSIFRPR